MNEKIKMQLSKGSIDMQKSAMETKQACSNLMWGFLKNLFLTLKYSTYKSHYRWLHSRPSCNQNILESCGKLHG